MFRNTRDKESVCRYEKIELNLREQAQELCVALESLKVLVIAAFFTACVRKAQKELPRFPGSVNPKPNPIDQLTGVILKNPQGMMIGQQIRKLWGSRGPNS